MTLLYLYKVYLLVKTSGTLAEDCEEHECHSSPHGGTGETVMYMWNIWMLGESQFSVQTIMSLCGDSVTT